MRLGCDPVFISSLLKCKFHFIVLFLGIWMQKNKKWTLYSKYHFLRKVDIHVLSWINPAKWYFIFQSRAPSIEIHIFYGKKVEHDIDMARAKSMQYIHNFVSLVDSLLQLLFYRPYWLQFMLWGSHCFLFSIFAFIPLFHSFGSSKKIIVWRRYEHFHISGKNIFWHTHTHDDVHYAYNGTYVRRQHKSKWTA